LHKFMNWDGPMLTDSGGYQIFAMGHGSVSEEVKGIRQKNEKTILKITEEGAMFRSYLDGQKIMMTPEISIDIQRKLGADLIVQLDECTPFSVSRQYTEASTSMSLRWGDRSLAEFKRGDTGCQALYGVIQGGIYPDLRRISAEGVSSQQFFGTAIGGSLGQSTEQMRDVVALTMSLVPADRPVHLLGIGRVEDIFFGVINGIDTFDCVQPTRIARHGHAITPFHEKGIINLKNACYKYDNSPLVENSEHPWLNYSKSYIHHLFRTKEILGPLLLTYNNVYQMNQLMKDIQNDLAEGSLKNSAQKWLSPKAAASFLSLLN